MTGIEAPARTCPPGSVGPVPATAQARALLERNVTRLRRNPASFAGAVIAPTVFFLGFFVVLRKVIEAQGIDYPQYLTPAIVVQAMLFVGMSSAYYVADDAATGLAARLRAMPVASPAVVAGRVGADLVRAVVSLAVVVGLGFAVGFRFAAGPLPAVAFVLLTLAFAAAMAVLFGLVALTAGNPEAAAQTLSLPYVVAFMLSTALVPAERFPGWLEPVVRNQPVSQVIGALRALSGGGATARPVAVALAWVAGMLVVGVLLSARALRRAR